MISRVRLTELRNHSSTRPDIGLKYLRSDPEPLHSNPDLWPRGHLQDFEPRTQVSSTVPRTQTPFVGSIPLMIPGVWNSNDLTRTLGPRRPWSRYPLLDLGSLPDYNPNRTSDPDTREQILNPHPSTGQWTSTPPFGLHTQVFPTGLLHRHPWPDVRSRDPPTGPRTPLVPTGQKLIWTSDQDDPTWTQGWRSCSVGLYIATRTLDPGTSNQTTVAPVRNCGPDDLSRIWDTDDLASECPRLDHDPTRPRT